MSTQATDCHMLFLSRCLRTCKDFYCLYLTLVFRCVRTCGTWNPELSELTGLDQDFPKLVSGHRFVLNRMVPKMQHGLFPTHYKRTLKYVQVQLSKIFQKLAPFCCDSYCLEQSTQTFITVQILPSSFCPELLPGS
jgi:hypothetical protein